MTPGTFFLTMATFSFINFISVPRKSADLQFTMKTHFHTTNIADTHLTFHTFIHYLCLSKVSHFKTIFKKMLLINKTSY